MSWSDAQVSNATFLIRGLPAAAVTCANSSQATMSESCPHGSGVASAPCDTASNATDTHRPLSEIPGMRHLISSGLEQCLEIATLIHPLFENRYLVRRPSSIRRHAA